MFEKIFNVFFCKQNKTDKSRCITVKSSVREVKFKASLQEKIEETKKQTCLSGYFKNVSGLNVKEREMFNRVS